MTDAPRQYPWRWFNWGLAILAAAIWGFPHGWSELLSSLYAMFDLSGSAHFAAKSGWQAMLRDVETPVAVFLTFGLFHLLLGPIWKNPVALTISADGLDHPMLFSRPLAWDEIETIEASAPKPWRQIRVTLNHDDPPRHHCKGWLARLDRWSRKFDPSGPFRFMLSGWQINFKRNELAAFMKQLKGAPGAGHSPPDLEPQQIAQ